MRGPRGVPAPARGEGGPLALLFWAPYPQILEIGNFLRTIWHPPTLNPLKFVKIKNSGHSFQKFAEILFRFC